MITPFACPVRVWSVLTWLDQEIADECRAGGCTYCGGRLHSSPYPRSPRGLAPALMALDHKRFSFSCGTCRLRNTPESLRYFGRRIYGSWIFLRVMVADPGSVGRLLKRFSEECGVPSWTLRRWRRWWHESFPESRAWPVLRARFSGGIDEAGLPKTLVEQMSALTLTGRLLRVREHMWPWAAISTQYGGRKFRAEFGAREN